MQIDDDALSEFLTLYNEEFGEDISRKEASEMAHRLLMLYDVLAKKLPGEQDPASLQQPNEEDDHPRVGFRT